MITLLIWVLILCLVFGVIVWAIQLIPLPTPYGQVALAVVALIFILILVGMLLGDVPLRPMTLR